MEMPAKMAREIATIAISDSTKTDATIPTAEEIHELV
jgi:hypothetical protein